MKEYIFKLTDKVRDYECDLQGVVNNANYQHYMEHTRHEFLESLGENFGAMHDKGVDGFVSHVDIDFKTSLKSGDSYISCLNVYKKGVKLVFEQDIYRASDGVLATKGKVESVVVQDGKLTRGEYFDEMLKGYKINYDIDHDRQTDLPNWLNYDKRGGRYPGPSASASLGRCRSSLYGKEAESGEDTGHREPYGYRDQTPGGSSAG